MQDGVWQIFTMNGDGSGIRQLTRSRADNRAPVWSPDGRRIVFVSDRDGNKELYRMDADGSHLTNLTRNPGQDYNPAWSPDGSRIAFIRHVEEGGEIRDGIFVPRRSAGDLPGFADTTFRDRAGLERQLDAVMAQNGRPAWVGPMRDAVRRHDTMDALVPRLLRRLRLRAGLAERTPCAG